MFLMFFKLKNLCFYDYAVHGDHYSYSSFAVRPRLSAFRSSFQTFSTILPRSPSSPRKIPGDSSSSAASRRSVRGPTGGSCWPARGR